MWSLRLLLFGLVAVSVPAHAADLPSFEAIGRAPISSGDRVRARERALDDAFQHAVEAAVGALLGTDALVKKASDLRLKILPRARTYVQSYRVLDEGEREPNVFSVHVSADVAADRLVKELADKVAKPTKALPRLVSRVVLCVNGIQDQTSLSTAIRARLSSGNVELVAGSHCDEQGLLAEMQASGAMGALVIDVKPGSLSPIRGTSLLGAELRLMTRLLDAGGRPRAEGHGEGAGYGSTAAASISSAALGALLEALAPIEAALGSEAPTRAGISVRVVGVRKYTELASVRSALERLPGVDGVEPRRFNPGMPGSIELTVRTAQSQRAIADALKRVAATYQLAVREADGVIVIDIPESADLTAVEPKQP